MLLSSVDCDSVLFLSMQSCTARNGLREDEDGGQMVSLRILQETKGKACLSLSCSSRRSFCRGPNITLIHSTFKICFHFFFHFFVFICHCITATNLMHFILRFSGQI